MRCSRPFPAVPSSWSFQRRENSSSVRASLMSLAASRRWWGRLWCDPNMDQTPWPYWSPSYWSWFVDLGPLDIKIISKWQGLSFTSYHDAISLGTSYSQPLVYFEHFPLQLFICNCFILAKWIFWFFFCSRSFRSSPSHPPAPPWNTTGTLHG